MSSVGNLPSVMEGLGTPGAPAPRASRGPGLVQRLRTRWSNAMKDPGRRKRAKRLGTIAGIVAAAGLAVGLFFWLRPRPTPDYLNDDMAEVLDYTLLSNEFNALPVRKRMALMGDLIRRLKAMSAGDSAMMAAFAAGIAGKAREQMEENAAKLVVDAWDEKAKDYARSKPEDREKFLEDAFVDFEKMMEATTRGEVRNIPDEERVARMKRQAKRDMENMKDPSKRPDEQSMGQFMTFIDKNLGSRTTPSQRVRSEQMLRDMSRHFRGQDVTTGNAK